MNEINILGHSDGWELAPQDNCWGLNDFLTVRKVDLLFDMHNLPRVLSGKDKLERRTIDQVRAGLVLANQTSTPVYSLDTWFECLKYPLEEIVKRFKSDYFSCSVAYAIAFALFKDYKKINLYGIALGIGTEYSFQKPSVEFWIGVAKGMGVEVNMFGNTEVLAIPSRHLYGYNTKQGELKSG